MNRHVLKRVVAELRDGPDNDLERRLAAHLARRPRCPVARYLSGCACFDRGRIASGVRHMMIAHHAEPALASAALLVFAGLNWVSRRREALLPVLLDTWEEFRRPEFDQSVPERTLLDAFAEPLESAEGLSPLAQRLWRLPIATLRQQLREALRSTNRMTWPLLVAPI